MLSSYICHGDKPTPTPPSHHPRSASCTASQLVRERWSRQIRQINVCTTFLLLPDTDMSFLSTVDFHFIILYSRKLLNGPSRNTCVTYGKFTLTAAHHICSITKYSIYNKCILIIKALKKIEVSAHDLSILNLLENSNCFGFMFNILCSWKYIQKERWNWSLLF